MKHLDDAFVAKEVIERLQRQVPGQRIDQNGVLVPFPRQGKLHETQLGIIGPFPEKLRIDRHVVLIVGFLAERSQFLRRRDHFHLVFVLLPDVPAVSARTGPTFLTRRF